MDLNRVVAKCFGSQYAPHIYSLGVLCLLWSLFGSYFLLPCMLDDQGAIKLLLLWDPARRASTGNRSETVDQACISLPEAERRWNKMTAWSTGCRVFLFVGQEARWGCERRIHWRVERLYGR